MTKAEIRIFIEGQEFSFRSFAEQLLREVRTSVREELSQNRCAQKERPPEPVPEASAEAPCIAVSKREAARLLGISTRTVENYVASKAIRCVRVGRRVLIPMKSVNEVATRGLPRHKACRAEVSESGQSA